MPDAPQKPPYEVVLTEDDWEAIKRLPRESQQVETFKWLWGHVSQTPAMSVPGKVKQLKGAFSHLHQLDIGDGYRIIYRVDEAEKRVYVEEIGSHPDWRKSRGGRIRR